LLAAIYRLIITDTLGFCCRIVFCKKPVPTFLHDALASFIREGALTGSLWLSAGT
jgi:hypothetical protein